MDTFVIYLVFFGGGGIRLGLTILMKYEVVLTNCKCHYVLIVYLLKLRVEEVIFTG